jgi:hypothetical protein
MDPYEEKYFDEKFGRMHDSLQNVDAKVGAVYVQLDTMKNEDKTRDEKADILAECVSELKSRSLVHESRLNGHDDDIEHLQDDEPVKLDTEAIAERGNRWKYYGIAAGSAVVVVLTWLGAGTPGA